MNNGPRAAAGDSSRSTYFQATPEVQRPASSQLPTLDFNIPLEPRGLSEEQQILWSSAAAAVEDEETLSLLQDFQQQLEAVFLYFSVTADRSSKRLMPFLASADSGPGQGFLRMLQQYDICPTYVSKRDAKKAYLLMCKMYDTTESDGLPINAFVHALVLTTLLGLSRPTYQNLYPQTVVRALSIFLICAAVSLVNVVRCRNCNQQNKVNVMTKMWGVGVPHKLQVLKSNKRI
jgi:hypothetical protein